ncbi:MAG: DUF2280 domain-containing protein, partial [Nitratireductor sp.]
MRTSDPTKRFIVMAVARFDTPQTVRQAVLEEFGIELTRQAIEAYDPTKYAGRDLGKRWRKLFDETRKTFTANLSDIGIAHRSARLRRMEALFHKAEALGNYRLCLKPLKRAAIEAESMPDRRRLYSSIL